MPEEDKIPYKDIRIEKLEERHINLLGKFEAIAKDLKDFLIQDAYKNQEMAISTTYLWFHNPTNDLVAYVTILNDAVRVHGTQLGKQFMDIGIQYKTLPALKIGRMCVHKNYIKKGIGTYIIEYVMSIAIKISEESGCRFIVLDAKTETGAQHAENNRVL